MLQAIDSNGRPVNHIGNMVEALDKGFAIKVPTEYRAETLKDTLNLRGIDVEILRCGNCYKLRTSQ